MVETNVFELISEAVSRAKGGHVLAPVTVVVPNRSAIRDAWKNMATHGGAANTQVLTLDLLVEKPAAQALTPRTPLPFPLFVASVQRVLEEDPGLFSDVADQPITADALAAASWTLGSYANPSAPDSSPLVADMLRVHRSATAALGASYCLPHEAHAAAKPLIGDLGRLVIVQPNPRDSTEADFLECLSKHGEVIDLDEDPTGTLVVHASDADDEIRAVTRIVRKHLLNGTPGHRGVSPVNGAILF